LSQSIAPPGLSVQAPANRLTLSAERFTWATMLICLVMQRIAIPAGGELKISLATPLVLLLALWGLMSGSLALDRRRLALFCGLFAIGCISVAVQASMPLAMAPRSSLTSFEYWLLITGFAVLRFRRPMAQDEFFRIICATLAFVAIAGLLQFLLQFVHVSLFSFSGIVPDRFLIEDQYAVVLPTESGTIRSNGFFLVEPSVFSQFMALGAVIEGSTFRRRRFLALFFTGLLISVSGTGWMVLGAFVLQLALTSGPRGVLAAVGIIVFAVLFVALSSLVDPALLDNLLGRMDELSMQGTSGYERFVTPFMVLKDVLHAQNSSFFTGIGPGGSELLSVPYFYRLNAPVKILLEYGVLGLGFYIALLTVALRTKVQWGLLGALLVLLLFTGGYQQFSPILFPVLLIGSVATLSTREPGLKGAI
jgi:hypothetical protein